jgi:hypothetical protein
MCSCVRTPGYPGLKVPNGVSHRLNRGRGFRQVSPHALIAPIGHLATAPAAVFRRNVETKAGVPLAGKQSQETTGDVLLWPLFVTYRRSEHLSAELCLSPAF